VHEDLIDEPSPEALINNVCQRGSLVEASPAQIRPAEIRRIDALRPCPRRGGSGAWRTSGGSVEALGATFDSGDAAPALP
jgi:hypothetical protein